MKPSSRLILALSVLGCVGGWVIGFKAWPDLASPQAIGGLFTTLSATLLAAFGVKTGGNKPPDPDGGGGQ